MEPEIIEQDELTVTLKMPDGTQIKMSRAALPGFLEELKFAILRQGAVN